MPKLIGFDNNDRFNLTMALIAWLSRHDGQPTIAEAAAHFGATERDITRSAKDINWITPNVGFMEEGVAYLDPDSLAEGILDISAIDYFADIVKLSGRQGSAVLTGLTYLATIPEFEGDPDLQALLGLLGSGLAVANTIAAIRAGVRQLECTINGIGERAGNCSLEEVVMAVKTRRDYFGLDVNIDTQHIVAASRMVSQTTGFVVQPNKAVVGANAFAHASGIHQDGVLKARDTYEIMRAEDVGWSANKIVLGKLSGRNAFKQRLQELGVELESETEINAAFARFKELADRKSEIFDEDILALVSDESVTSEKEQYGFVSLSQRSETGEQPSASIVFTVDGKEVKGEATGNGPVDASLKAIESHVQSGAEMVLYSVNAISGSTESQGEVTVRLQNSGRVVNGVGADPDIVVASAKAYLSALNKLQSKADRVAAQG